MRLPLMTQSSSIRKRNRFQRLLARNLRLNRRKLQFEALESRRVLASNPVLTVTVAEGTGPGSLSEMILLANAQAGEDRIVFAPEITSVRPAANLPWITSAVTIDGENRVTIDGTNAPQHGLWFNGSGVQILNLTVNNFSNGFGIYFFDASNGKVQNSRLGTDQAGLVAQPNDLGVMIHDSSNIIVGTDGDGINDAIAPPTIPHQSPLHTFVLNGQAHGLTTRGSAIYKVPQRPVHQ